MEQRVVNPNYQKWLSKIIGFDFEIRYKPGRENRVADALSRVTTTEEIGVAALTFHKFLDFDKVREEVDKDVRLAKIRKGIEEGLDEWPMYSLQNGQLLYKERLVLPKGSTLIPPLLNEYHSSLVGGHSRFLRTYKRMAGDIYWEGMKKDIKCWVDECSVCQQKKYQALSPTGLLQPFPIPFQIWDDLTMDFIEGMPKSEGFDAILVVVDRLSKYAHFSPLKHPFTAKSVAAIFVKDIVCLHGMPRSIVSNQDKIFLSHFWTELFRLQGTLLSRSTAYHPQSDG